LSDKLLYYRKQTNGAQIDFVLVVNSYIEEGGNNIFSVGRYDDLLPKSVDNKYELISS